MDRLLVTRQRVDAVHRSPDIVSRLEAGVEGSDPPKRAPSFAYKALSRSLPFAGASFPSRPAYMPSSATLRNLLIQPNLDGFHVLSINYPQLYRRIRRHVLEAFTPLR